MGVEWKPKHVGGSWWALAEGRIVGEVVPYGGASGPGVESRPTYWRAFVRRDELPGEFADELDAKTAVELALDTT